LDRIDIRLKVETPSRLELADTSERESSEKVRARVEVARLIAAERFSEYSFNLNSQIPSELLRGKFKAHQKAMTVLHNLIDREEITARGFHKLLRLSWTIADLQSAAIPGLEHLERALDMRSAGEITL
jgi:magnesium chelatase family protein